MGISREQALDCFKSDDLIGIGMEADAVRRRLHPEGVVSYGVEAVVAINGRGLDEIYDEIAGAEENGATGVSLRCGGVSAEALEDLLAGVKRRSPEMWLQALELGAMPLERLRDAGLDSIGGVGVDADALSIHRAAHEAGMLTTATMIFGAGEGLLERVAQLEAVRLLQEETGGFAAFVPLSFHAEGGRELDEATAVEYLKTLAISRMLLDTVENVQSDWTRQGLKVLQMGLRFGGNDVGSVRVEQTKGATEEELRRVIRDAGFRPAQRDLGYRAMMVG